jgi:hypothetical protein
MPKKRSKVKITTASNASLLTRSSIRTELDLAGNYSALKAESSSSQKKNFAEALSRALAQRFANALRKPFPSILPRVDGSGQESKARTGKGLKKLDVNYSTVELGLGLGVSIKTINFRDARSQRYTKNYTRADNEFRAEAADYHQRQPYAVLCAVFFIPKDACNDGGKSDPSSFGHAVKIFRFRAGRKNPTDDPTQFERLFIGLYDTDSNHFGDVGFFDVLSAPPKHGVPKKLFTFEQCLEQIRKTYDTRNNTSFEWADAPTEEATGTILEDDLSDT